MAKARLGKVILWPYIHGMEVQAMEMTAAERNGQDSTGKARFYTGLILMDWRGEQGNGAEKNAQEGIGRYRNGWKRNGEHWKGNDRIGGAWRGKVILWPYISGLDGR